MPSVVTKKEETKMVAASVDTENADAITKVYEMMAKKIRNLEKRKTKLEANKKELLKGKTLTDEQKIAVEHIDDVDTQIALNKEVLKNIESIKLESSKQQKWLKKKEEKERILVEQTRIRELLRIQDVLNSLGNDIVREDFLAGTNGAPKFTEEELKRYDELYKKLCPTREDIAENQHWPQVLDESAQFAHSFLSAISKPAPGFEAQSFKQLKEFMEKLAGCSYFEAKCNVQTSEKEEPVDTTQQEHRRIEAMNSFESSEHSATPSLYTTPANAVVNGGNLQQVEQQSQRFRAGSDVPISFLQEDQTANQVPNVPVSYVNLPPNITAHSSYGQSVQDALNWAVDSGFTAPFPNNLTNMNVVSAVQQQQNSLQPLDLNAYAKNSDESTGHQNFDSKQNNQNFPDSSHQETTNGNTHPNAEAGQRDSSSDYDNSGNHSEFVRARGRGRGGDRGGRGSRGGAPYRGAPRGHYQGRFDDGAEDGGGFRRGGGRGYHNDGGEFRGGYRRGGDYRGGGYGGGNFRGASGDRPAPRRGMRGGGGGNFGGSRGGFGGPSQQHSTSDQQL